MNDHDSPEEIERDIERTRANVSRTLNELQERLAPRNLVSDTLNSPEVMSALRSAGSGTLAFAADLGRVIGRKPLPVLLTGIGLAWLAFSKRANNKSGHRVVSYGPDRAPTSMPREDVGAYAERQDPSRAPTHGPSEDDLLGAESGGEASGDYGAEPAGNDGSGASDTGAGRPLDTRTDAQVTEELKATAARKRAASIRQRAAERARGAAASVSGGVGRVSQTLSEGVERMTGAMKGSGGSAYRTTKDVAGRATSAARQVPARVESAARSAASFLEENPILSGGIALVLGAALALMIPPTRREREFIGETSDEVKSSVKQAVKEQVDRAKDVVATAAEAAADAARKEVKGEAGEPAPAAPAAQTTGEPLP